MDPIRYQLSLYCSEDNIPKTIRIIAKKMERKPKDILNASFILEEKANNKRVMVTMVAIDVKQQLNH